MHHNRLGLAAGLLTLVVGRPLAYRPRASRLDSAAHPATSSPNPPETTEPLRAAPRAV